MGGRAITEGIISTFIEFVRAEQLRITRLAGDQAALADAMQGDESAKASEKVKRWGDEAHRIATELADMIDVTDRFLGPPTVKDGEVDPNADTLVLDVGEFAGSVDE